MKGDKIIKMNSHMYDKVSKNRKAKKDTKFTMAIIIVIIISLIFIFFYVWYFGFRYRFSKFLQNFADCTAYAREEESLTIEMDGKLYRVSEDNMQGIFNYITLNGSGKESKDVPDKKPITLDYGNGAVMKFWSVPPDKYSVGSGLFIQYEDTDGNSYSYISYKMNLDTIVTRYLLYNNVEIKSD